MADSKYNIDEVRFITRDEHLTEVYVLVRGLDADAVALVGGWHHRTYPAHIPTVEILGKMFTDLDADERILGAKWGRKAPFGGAKAAR